MTDHKLKITNTNLVNFANATLKSVSLNMHTIAHISEVVSLDIAFLVKKGYQICGITLSQLAVGLLCNECSEHHI